MLACTVQPFYFYCWYRSYYNVISYKLRTGKIETKNTNFMFPEKDFRSLQKYLNIYFWSNLPDVHSYAIDKYSLLLYFLNESS